MITKGLLLACLLTAFNLLNAQTGSFSTTLKFNGSDRNVACYVPTDYNAANSYQLMVCLHGAGDNAVNYRNALISSLKWNTLFTNTIFLCPDGGDDKSKDFYSPKGDEKFISDVIAYGKKQYIISNSKTILQGFSLGGRSALKFGLDNPTLMDGLLLNTPAIQGLLDLENNPSSSLMFNYSNAHSLPIFITVGVSDYTYFGTTSVLVKKLKVNNAPLKFLSVPGLGHSVPSTLLLKYCQSFFNKPNSHHFDADLFENISSNYWCNPSGTSEIYVRNNGDSVIKSMTIYLGTDKDSKIQTWNGTILPNEHAKIKLNYTMVEVGIQNFKINIRTINQSKVDEDTANNTYIHRLEVLGDKKASTISEGFEEAEPGFQIIDKGGLFGWYIDTEVKKTGASSIGTFNTILIFNTLGAKESFTSPIIDVSSLSYKSMSFDLAFNYHKYTPPYFTAETIFTDTLEVQISTDCGNSFNTLYKKWGKDLATVSNPILNPLNVQSCFFTPKSNEWRREVIDLAKYSNSNNAIIKFNYISGLGGSINIDNISAGFNTTGVNSPVRTNEFMVYPNPANNLVNIQLPTRETYDVRILSQSGQVIEELLSDSNTQLLKMDISHLQNGFYLIEIKSDGFNEMKKLIISR